MITKLSIPDMLYESGVPLKVCYSVPISGKNAAKGHEGKARQKYAQSNYRTRPAKYSTILIGLEVILEMGVCYAYREKSVLSGVESLNVVTGMGDQLLWLNAPRKELRYMNDMPTSSIRPSILTTLLISAIRKDSYVRTIFDKCVEEYRIGGHVSEHSAALLCDEFYYEYVVGEGMNEIQIIEDAALEMSATQAMSVESFISIAPAEYFSVCASELIAEKRIQQESETEAGLLQSAKDGRFLKMLNMTEKMAKKVPSLNILDDYLPNKEYFEMVRDIEYNLNSVQDRIDAGETNNLKIIRKNFVNAIFLGSPGSGKSITAHALAATFGLPYYVVTSHKDTEADEFEGKLKVSDDGKLEFSETEFLEAYKNGGIVVIEEYNFLPEGIASIIMEAIESPFILKQDGVHTVTRHPYCIVICTGNKNTAGTNDVNAALKNRCMRYSFKEQSDEEFVKILSEIDGFDEKMAAKVYDSYKSIVEMVKEANRCPYRESILMSLSLRSCKNALQHIAAGNSFSSGIERGIIGQIDDYDEDLAETIRAGYALLS